MMKKRVVDSGAGLGSGVQRKYYLEETFLSGVFQDEFPSTVVRDAESKESVFWAL